MVLEVEAVLADGSVKDFGKQRNESDALSICGRLGILTKVKLKLGPAFSLNCAITRLPCDMAFRQVVEIAKSQRVFQHAVDP